MQKNQTESERDSAPAFTYPEPSLKLRHLLFAACLASASLQARANDPEVSAIPLFASRHYDPNDEQGRGFKSFITGIGVKLVGPGKDLSEEIRQKLDNRDLREYFPDPSERRRIADRIAEGMRSRYLSRGYNNRNIVAATRYATSEMIVAVTKRVLEKEGLKDPKRAALWSGKILAPYHACASQARNYKEIGKCGEVVEADLVKNMGLAMSHEIPRQEFGPAYSRGRAQEYRACMARSRAVASQVKDCAFASVKNGARLYSRAKVIEAAKKELGEARAVKLAERVLPEFNRCLDAASDRPAFVKCADKLLGRAGSELAAEAIRNDPRLRAAVSKPEEIERLAAAGRTAFGRCFAENERGNVRDASGTLRTDNCESYVKMETIREVASAMILGRIEQNMPGSRPEEVARVRREVAHTLSGCWDSKKSEVDNATCLRKAAMKLATLVAGERLAREIPKDLLEKDPALKDRLLGAFAACLEKKLPANLFSASNVDSYTDACAAEVTRATALTVAETKVRAALSQVADQMPDEGVMNGLIDTFVKKAFAECLGQNPTKAKLDECSLRLQKNIASTLAQALLPFKVDEFLRQGGGLEAYGLDQAKKNELLAGVIKGHKECLRKNVKSVDSAVSEQEVNDCFKATIRDMALRLGPLEFERMAKANGVSTSDPAFAQLREQFSAELGACIDEKKARDFSVADYMGGLESCQARLSKSFTVKVAKHELSKTIQELISDASAGGERERLEKQLFASFDACMDKARDAAAREACVVKLRQDATLLLARSGVKSRALKELDVAELPDSLKDIEKKLDECLGRNEGAEACTKAYVKQSISVLGKLVLHKKMKEVLADTYAQHSPALKPLEDRFENCVSAVDGALDAAFLGKLDACAKKLGDDAVEMGLELALGGFAAPPADAPTASATETETAIEPAAELSDKQLADMMSRTFLCLNGQLSLETETSLENIDPESIEAELLKLIGAYVAEDLKSARGRYEEVLEGVKNDLAAAGPEASRRKLVDHLVKGGMADQLLKAMLRAELEKAVQALPADKQPPEALRKALLDKATLDRALSPSSMEKLRPGLSDRVLEPVLAGGASLRSSQVLKALREARKLAASEALASPEFQAWAEDPALRHLRDALK